MVLVVMFCSIFPAFSKEAFTREEMEKIVDQVWKEKYDFQVYGSEDLPLDLEKNLLRISEFYQKLEKTENIGEKMKIASDLEKYVKVVNPKNDWIVYLRNFAKNISEYGIFAEFNGFYIDSDQYLPILNFLVIDEIQEKEVKIWGETIRGKLVFVNEKTKLHGNNLFVGKDFFNGYVIANTTNNAVIVIRHNLDWYVEFNQKIVREANIKNYRELDYIFGNCERNPEYFSTLIVFPAFHGANITPENYLETMIWHEFCHLKDFRDDNFQNIARKIDSLSFDTRAEINAYCCGLKNSEFLWDTVNEIVKSHAADPRAKNANYYALIYLRHNIENIVLEKYRDKLVIYRPDVNIRWQILYQLFYLMSDKTIRQDIADEIHEQNMKEIEQPISQEYIINAQSSLFPIFQSAKMTTTGNKNNLIKIIFILLFIALIIKIFFMIKNKKRNEKKKKRRCKQ